jgi:hypothetical protein
MTNLNHKFLLSLVSQFGYGKSAKLVANIIISDQYSAFFCSVQTFKKKVFALPIKETLY